MSRQLFLLTILALPARPAAAQDLARPLGMLPPVQRPALTSAPRLQETFLTDGTGSTLSLGWRYLRWGSVEVRLETKVLRPDVDYIFDYPAGVCRLTSVPPAGSVVQVRYVLVPRLSVPAPGSASVLTPAQGGALSAAPGAESGTPATALRSRSQALLEEFRPALGVQRDDGSVLVTNSGLRQQLESGLRQTEVNQQLTGESGTGRVSYFRADPFDPRSADDAREEFNSQLNLRPSPTSRLLVDNYFSRGSLFADEYDEAERRRVQFDQQWNKSAASLLWEHRRSDGFGVASALDALSLSLNRTVTSNLSAEGLFILRDSLFLGRETQSGLTLRQGLGSFADARGDLLFRRSSFTGDTLESGLTLSARPGKNDLQVALRQSDSELFGRFQRFSGQVDTALTSRILMHGEASLRSAESLGGVFTYGLGLTAQPTTRSLLETAFSQSTGDKTGRDQSQSFRVSVDPSAAFRLQVGIDRLDSTTNGRSLNSMWIVTVGGQRYVRFEGYSGLYAMQEEGDYSDALYRLEVRPAPALALSGSLRAVSEQEQMRQLAGVGATLRLLPGVDLSANYRQPRGPGTSPQDPFGRDLRLSVAPTGGLRVFGEYSVRPEDPKGLLVDQTHRTVGLETRLGSFAVEGSITSLDDPTSIDPGRTLDLLASLRLGAGTRLYGGVRSLDNSLADDVRSRIYRLGVSQNAGESFFVLLEGQLGWLVDSTGARTWSADDTRAQARFGLRF